MRSYWTISPRSRDFLFVPYRQVLWSCGQPQGFGILAETAQDPRTGNAGWGGGCKSVSGAARRRSAGAELPAKREASTPRYRCGHRRCIEKHRSLKERLAIGIIHSADAGSPTSRESPATGGGRFEREGHLLVFASGISARQTWLCGALRSRTTVLRRRRSTGLRVMEIPVRMRQTCMQRARRESLLGFKCQI